MAVGDAFALPFIALKPPFDSHSKLPIIVFPVVAAKVVFLAAPPPLPVATKALPSLSTAAPSG